MISKISFSGSRIFDNYRTLEGPMVEKTTVDEDEKDLLNMANKLFSAEKKDIVKNNGNGYRLPAIIADEYKFSMHSTTGFEPNQLFVKNLKENITRVFSSNSSSHTVRSLFRECLQFIRDNAIKR